MSLRTRRALKKSRYVFVMTMCRSLLACRQSSAVKAGPNFKDIPEVPGGAKSTTPASPGTAANNLSPHYLMGLRIGSNLRLAQEIQNIVQAGILNATLQYALRARELSLQERALNEARALNGQIEVRFPPLPSVDTVLSMFLGEVPP
ncbi:hypothetical protein BJ138DRAFT_1148301 [Hygrophoropsis aurantiaca]|uniref:Uncharacterized protein n=1 Tax=Hygrophoropsis aurantiaca TaxID=72124 RepID=A0ACB8AH65_9AGAM|nr:hypothetical protein BJ138DRAFT_1148301 [Hygrophoropsis aurantiaca]